MTDRNKQLATILHHLASIYRFLGGENPFRAMAYQKASQAIQGLPDDITYYIEQDTLEEIPGIGKSMEKEIREFNKSGKIRRFEKLKKSVPYELMELMDISGFGPKSLKRIYEELHLRTKDEVIDALRDGTISELKGFGEKKVENMLRGLKLHKILDDRMILWEALQKGEEIMAKLREFPEVKKIELAGSLRRRKETIGDFDILATTSWKGRKKLVDYFTSSALADRVLAKGETKASVILNNKQADLRIVDDDEWGSAMQYFTGSKEHNIHLRTIARDKGYKISEYGIFNIRNDKRVAGKTEEEIYHTLGMQLMPPEMREDRGEIDLAIRHKIPKLIELDDICGDLQMHSDWSDGLQTLEEIVEFVRKNFRYDYIAVTDHTKASRVAGGMDERGFLKQIQVIKAINHKLDKDFLKTGAEVDILANGSLDLSDEVLAQLDWVTASIHSGFGRNNTDRLIKACKNPYVHCIGHPTGRLIGKREAYPVDINELVHAARKTGTALEINAQPDRMDLNDDLAMTARMKGVKLVISTDSHKPTDFHFMKLGVYVARRAWCTAEDILNTRSWKDVRKIVSKKSMKVVA
jgi:DNA polymerase (family 10)